MVIEMYFNYDSIHNVPDAVIQDKKNKFEPFERALHFKKKRLPLSRQPIISMIYNI